MRRTLITLLVLALFSAGCMPGNYHDPVAASGAMVGSAVTETSADYQTMRGLLLWGFYDLEIARDASSCSIAPDRSAMADWGYHLNAVKLLETSPCTNCLWLSNIHLLPNGDLSIDVSIKHPFDNPVYTGFDVRGIIMFPASQYFPDNDLRQQAELPPYDGWISRWSSWKKGDAELMNPDAWTEIWAPDITVWHLGFDVPYTTYPIQNYYPGKFASGEELGTVNAYRHFWSNENRHMFEVGKTVTRTYVIRPPAEGPVLASYAIYAHWAEPLKIPVTDPAVDFGPEANSPIPYEFWITQDSPIDPDPPHLENTEGEHIHWHIKSWDIGTEYWGLTYMDLLYVNCIGANAQQHSSGLPDDYGFTGFYADAYKLVPGWLPGEWPYFFNIRIENPKKPWWLPIAHDFYIADIAIEAPDGEW